MSNENVLNKERRDEACLKKLAELNPYTKVNNKGFNYTLSFGLFSFAFSDFGEKHIILDKTGKEKGKFYISNITKEQKGKIKIYYS